MSLNKIGIIGGGQLGLMLCEEAHKLGAKTIVLDPSKDAPAFKVSDEHICATFDDFEALEDLCKRADVITYEFENVRSDYLIDLENKYNIKQGFKPLFDGQDRIREKTNANNHGLKTAKFFDVTTLDDAMNAIKELGYPCLYKTRTLGYDGHGQVLLKSEADIKKLDEFLGGPGIIEEFIKFDYEASIVMVSDGKNVINFPIGRNIHKNGILDLTIVPSGMPKSLEDEMIKKSKNFMLECGYKGILAIEYFIKGNEFYFNEMAPRPHNSGHYTIEGCNTNQFRELDKYLLDLPMEEPKLLHPTIMKNILGQDVKDYEAYRKIPFAFIHDYGKSENRINRKMGHITFTNINEEEYNKYKSEVLK